MNLVVKQTWTRNLLGAAVLAALAACGGGGGGSANNNTGGGTEQTASVTGVAAKGLLQQAQVIAYRAGTRTEVARATTADDGSYTLTGLPPGVAVLIEVTPIAGTTTMVDEETNAVVTLPADFKLRAATVADASGVASVQITPFSEMAVAKAENAGGLTADNINAANADIRAYVGFDVLSDRPEFENSGTRPANKAALVLAAVSKLASSPSALLELECDDEEESTAARVKCVVDKMAQKRSSDDGLTGLINTAVGDVARTDYPANASITTLDTQVSELVPVATRGTGIEAAKAFIATIRNNLNRISTNTGTAPAEGTLVDQLRTTSEAFQNAADPLGGSSREVYGVALTVANKLNESTLAKNEAFTLSSDVAAAINCRVDAVTADEAICRITYGRSTGNADTRYQHWVRVFLTPEIENPVVTGGVRATSYSVETKLLVRNIDTSTDEATLLPASGAAYAATITLKTDDETMYPYGMQLQGRFATGLNQALTTNATNQPRAAFNDVDLSITPEITLVGTPPDGRKIRLDLSGTFSAGGGYAPTLTGTVTGHVESQFDGTSLSYLAAAETLRAERSGQLALNVPGRIQGSLSLSRSRPTLDAETTQQYLPEVISFTGSIYNGTNEPLFTGSISGLSDPRSLDAPASVESFDPDLPYSADNRIANATVVLNGEVRIPGGEPVSLKDFTVAEQLFDGALRYSANGRLLQGDLDTPSAQLFLEIESSVGSVPGYLQISNSEGIMFRLTEGQQTARITRSEVTVGSFDRRRAKIDYVDGSYEQY